MQSSDKKTDAFRRQRAGKQERSGTMQTRIAVTAIIVEDMESAEGVNQLLHEYRQYIGGAHGGFPTGKNRSL